MSPEVVVGAVVTACALGSMWLADRVLSRERQVDKELDDREERVRKEPEERERKERARAELVARIKRERVDSPPAIVPFNNYFIGSRCPKCDSPTVHSGGSFTENHMVYKAIFDMGTLYYPKACEDPEVCPAAVPHLHVRCLSCKSRWLMAVKEAGR